MNPGAAAEEPRGPKRNGPTSLQEYQQLAKRILPTSQYDLIVGAAADEVSVRRARETYDTLLLRSRVLVDVSYIELSTTVLGEPVGAPIMLAPTGFHGRAHPDAEAATATAAASRDVVMVLSVNSTLSLEEVAAVSNGPLWFQQNFYQDPGQTRRLIDRAVTAGCRAICMTLDSPAYPPPRDRLARHNYRRPASPNFAARKTGSHDAATRRHTDPDIHLISRTASAGDLARVVEYSPVPILVKGVMTTDDARACVASGVSGVIVSNHGARNLDTTPAPIEVLPQIVEELDGRIEVFVDGGIRRGTDVLKALAFGARAVLIGRPLFWGLAAGGAPGLMNVIDLLCSELRAAMAACGQTETAAVDRDTVVLEPPLRTLAEGRG